MSPIEGFSWKLHVLVVVVLGSREGRLQAAERSPSASAGTVSSCTSSPFTCSLQNLKDLAVLNERFLHGKEETMRGELEERVKEGVQRRRFLQKIRSNCIASTTRQRERRPRAHITETSGRGLTDSLNQICCQQLRDGILAGLDDCCVLRRTRFCPQER
eukprot:scaffold5939_cov165-Ochromonas_danica.AAC.3